MSVVTIISSCVSKTRVNSYVEKYEKSLDKKECEIAESQIPLEKDETKYIRLYQGAVGFVGYLGSVPLTVGLDLLLLGRCRYTCIRREEEFLETIFPTSTYTYENTKDLRCPDTSYYVLKVIEISKCYESRGDKKSLEYAISQLNLIEDSYKSYGLSCLKLRDFNLIKFVKSRLAEKLANLSDQRAVSTGIFL